jgi:hypothetical protein
LTHLIFGFSELSDILLANVRRYGAEFKFSEAPKISQSMRIALNDLDLNHLWVIYPGQHHYPVDEKISVQPLRQLPGLAAQLNYPFPEVISSPGFWFSLLPPASSEAILEPCATQCVRIKKATPGLTAHSIRTESNGRTPRGGSRYISKKQRIHGVGKSSTYESYFLFLRSLTKQKESQMQDSP